MKDKKTPTRKQQQLETVILEKVSQVSSSIESSTHVDQVICALHSLALRLFPLHLHLDDHSSTQVLDAEIPSDDSERDEWSHVFYHGVAFPAMATTLIYNVASNWLPRFPPSAKKQVYDSYFVKGPSTEIIQALVPALVQNGPQEEFDQNAVLSNIERLLVLCLLENRGLYRMVEEFTILCRTDEHADGVLKLDELKSVARAAQLIASIPDKSRLQASSALSSHLFFRQVVIQLLEGAEERVIELYDRLNDSDGGYIFVGETFSRICRRGSADVLLVEMIPRILNHVRSCLSTCSDSMDPSMLMSKHKSRFWPRMMESIKDQHSVERLSEELLRQLATENITDVEAYWVLWLLFHRTFSYQTAMRVMFVEKFLLWKVLPICCLRWIVQFSILECPPYNGVHICPKTKGFLETVQHLAAIWSKREFVQSAPVEQQAYITAAVGLCVEKMSREELETTKDVLHSILQGVSCRLESPIHLVRKMASSIALMFSKVVDPKNPLYLDDDCCDTIDWDFGLIPQPKKLSSARRVDSTSHNVSDSSSRKEKNSRAFDGRKKDSKDRNGGHTMLKDSGLDDPDGISDSAMLSSNYLRDEEDDDDVKSTNSEASNDSSLQPYDLSDDDADLQKRFSQLADVSVALRKPDDPDGVERALDVAERLIRAAPDELRHMASDLVRALVHVRCCDAAVEGEEDSAEGKRQKALVALLVTCPFESSDVLTKLLYSPNVDVSQRTLILDVMTEAAQELADSKVRRIKHQQRNLISTISGSQPWFVPSSRGHPGAGLWKEVLETETFLSWSQRYERELPSRPGQIKKGKSRRWSLGTVKESQLEWSKNKFPLHAASFMLPAMQGFDRISHGVDLLNRDFIVLGKLIYMLAVCMKCTAMHPEASSLAPALLDMLRSREVAHHAEAYVRRSVLFAASCILVALHPSYIASALIEGNQEISSGLEWVRTWALHIAESDPDTECSGMAMKCLQLHAEMALETSRALDSANSLRSKISALPSKTDDIIIPFSSTRL